MKFNQDLNKIKFRVLRITLLFSIGLAGVKFITYFITNSIALLSDAMESIINVIAGGGALFSIYYASKPKDRDHPYGHGKIENLSAGFEGALIFVAGISIISKGIYSFFFPPVLEKLDFGIAVSGFTGLCNFIMGHYLIKEGKYFNSFTMIANGKHLISDAVSSIGLILGLVLIYLTNILWIDNVIALILGSIILFTGFKLIYESATNLLDKVDVEKLNQLVSILNKNRRPKWIDIHNLRILKYGTYLHIDGHLTLPWYDLLEESHKEMAMMEKIVKENFVYEIEFFIHAEPCQPSSCPICTIDNCLYREYPFEKKIEWTVENLLPDSKHKIP